MLLASDQLRERLSDYLASDPGANAFVGKVKDHMSASFTGMSKEELLKTPESFLSVAALLIGIKMIGTENTNAKALSQSARERLTNPETAKIARLYLELEDTKEIVKPLTPYFHS